MTREHQPGIIDTLTSATVESRPRHPHARLVLASASATAFFGLAMLVTIGATRRLDDSVRELFRPNDVWAVSQVIFGNVVDGLAPPVAIGLSLMAGLVMAVRVQSIRPIGYVGVLAMTAVILTAVSKVILQRPDPHGGTEGFGGAFPSGHIAILLVSLSGVVLVLRARSRWWDWCVVAAVVLTMGVSLLFLAMHWFTDVVGGALLAAPIVAVASATRPRKAVHVTAPDGGAGADSPTWTKLENWHRGRWLSSAADEKGG